MPTITYLNLPEDKRERIFKAAMNEFAERNIETAKLSNIAYGADIPRASMYQYFTDKDDLYIYIFETLRSQRADYVNPAFELYKKEPFLIFYEDFFVRDSEFLLSHPLHLEIGKQCYGHAHGVSRKLIQKLQNHYKEIFLIGIDYDRERGLIRSDTDCSALANLCMHWVTDTFIFQSVYDCPSVNDIKERCMSMMQIIKYGVLPK